MSGAEVSAWLAVAASVAGVAAGMVLWVQLWRGRRGGAAVSGGLDNDVDGEQLVEYAITVVDVEGQ